jgi:hypothetical protein
MTRHRIRIAAVKERVQEGREVGPVTAIVGMGGRHENISSGR